MPLSDKQRASILGALHDTHITIWDGAIRSGKTTGSIIAFLRWLPDAPPGPVAVIGKTRDTIERNLLDPIHQLHPDAISKHTRRAPTCQIMGRQVELIGANDAQAESKIRGLTLAGAYVDEVTLLPEAFFVQLLGRLSVEGARLMGTTNPDGPNHWLKTGYLDKAATLGWGYWRFTMDDNPGLTPEYVAAKKREFTGLWYRRFIQGDWVSAQGAIYNMWDPDTHITPWQDLPPMKAIISVGMDYGTTNATAAVMIGLGDDNRLYAVDEFRADSTDEIRYTDSELSTMFRAWLTKPHLPSTDVAGNRMKPRYICLDPAAASMRAQLHHDGIMTEPADNHVNEGIAKVATGLAEGWLKISSRCTSLIDEIPGYAWDPKATAKGHDKPVKQADHSLDALRYGVYTTEAVWGRHIRKRTTA